MCHYKMDNNERLANESFEGSAYAFLQPHRLECNHQLLLIPWKRWEKTIYLLIKGKIP